MQSEKLYYEFKLIAINNLEITLDEFQHFIPFSTY